MKLQRLLGAIGAVVMSVSTALAAEQSSYVTPGAGPMSMATFVTNHLNPALRAIAACHNGSSAPANGPGSAPLAFQFWCDTTANPAIVKMYDGASWVAIGALNTTTHAWSPYLTGGTSGGVPYFASAGVMASSAALAQNGFVVGGGAGAAPASIAACSDDQVAFGRSSNTPLCMTVSGDITFASGVSAIGAGKVTNAQLATMAANTTKCNATAGAANPTDCNGATMRSNLGLVVGTNVEAWDSDLDCLAALATSGVVARTGSGACATRTVTAPAAGISISNGDGIAGNPTLALANDLAALEGLSGTGIARRIAPDTWSVGTAVANSELATMAAYTFKGNNSGSAAAPTDVDIAALTTKASPAAGDYVMLSDQAAAGAWKKATVGSVSSAGSVASINGATGSVTTDLSALQNCSLSVSAASGALTIALKDAAGSDPSAGSPCAINFRSATAATGTYATLSVTAATSLVVSSGSTLGVTSSTAFRLWVVGFNDAGTFRLGVINCAVSGGISPLTENIPASSTAEGGAGAADSGGVFYTGTAIASKAYRVLGYIEWSASGLTAGTWTTTNLLTLQSFGPGVRLPGERVQRVSMTSAVGTSISSSTYTITTLTKAITPTSAANPIRVFASAAILSGGSATVAIVQLGRNSNANMFGSFGVANISNTGAVYSSANALGYDLPNSTSSTTYSLYGRSSDNATNISVLPNSYQGLLEVEEIMG
ncbi:hypothetical protein ACFLEY_21730 [Bradyrhizobium sp. YCK136]|uniref:hypothetical protein n=1 Tax=Bradyrhizobium TaxID=374 RepID=UPI003595D9B6